MKTLLTSLILCAAALSAARANMAPTPVIVSAVMRPSTTLMDVVFRVNDPDDATVKVRALAFVDGERSFAKLLRPVTFVEGTAVKIGDAIASNTDHTLSWDVAADWSIDLGRVKFEILARDARGLLAFDWITIPAAGGKPALTISKTSPNEVKVRDALFWQYAAADPALALVNGVLKANLNGGVFDGYTLASAASVWNYGYLYILKKMNLAPADDPEWASTARVILPNYSAGTLYATNLPWSGITKLVSSLGETQPPAGAADIIDFVVSDGLMNSFDTTERRTYIALKSNGTVASWGYPWYGVLALNNQKDVVKISASGYHAMALRSDGKVIVDSFQNRAGEANVPAELTNVISVAAGGSLNGAYCLALKRDGTIISWGGGNGGAPTSIPGAVSIEDGLALKSDGTVVKWNSQAPDGLTNIASIKKYMAIKNDGTRVVWMSLPNGLNSANVITVVPGFAIAVKAP